MILDPDRLGDYIEPMYRAAWALCGSRHDAEDLVQETFLNVLKRPRLLRDGNEIGYLLRALRNTYSSRYRMRRAPTRPSGSCSTTTTRPPRSPTTRISSRELMEAVAERAAALPRRRDRGRSRRALLS